VKDAERRPAPGRKGEAVAGTSEPPAPLCVARKRGVKTGYAEGDRIEVREGLDAGERVITTGRNAVREGTEVQIIEDKVQALAAVPRGADAS